MSRLMFLAVAAALFVAAIANASSVRAAPPAYDADIDNDGRVGFSDLAFILNNPDDPRSDVNGDGRVDLVDIFIVLSQFGNTVETPSPTSAGDATTDATPSSTPAQAQRVTPTETPSPEPTDTSEPPPTDTSPPTYTDTLPPAPTNTPPPTAINTAEPTPTDTPAPTATDTPASTATRTPTPMPPTPTRTPTPTPGPLLPAEDLLGLNQIVSWRGDHNPQHEITLPDPMGCCYSWGQHPTEDTPSISGSHTVNAWLVVFRSADEQTTTPNVRINIRRLYAYVHTGGVWKKIYDGDLSGQWLASSNADTSGDYQNISPTIEPDGTYSFDIPPNRALHMGSNAPGLQFDGSDAVVSIVEARLVGPGSANYGIAAGADFRDPPGSGGSIEQSCWGHLGLLTKDWRALSCLSSSLSDAQILQNPPPIN